MLNGSCTDGGRLCLLLGLPDTCGIGMYQKERKDLHHTNMIRIMEIAICRVATSIMTCLLDLCMRMLERVLEANVTDACH